VTRYLGIDVGGTNCKLVVLEAAGAHPGGPPDPPGPLATLTLPTGTGDPGEVVDRLAAAGARLAADHEPVAAAGLGIPGLFDEATGRVVFLPNLPPAWTGHDVRGPLADRLGVPTALINDARAFTLAESRVGAAAGCSTVVCLTLGTGVGGGVVVDGRLRFGPHGRAGEVGHQVIDPDGPRCGCGSRGCVEAFAAGPAICRLGGRASPEAVFAAAATGEPWAPWPSGSPTWSPSCGRSGWWWAAGWRPPASGCSGPCGRPWPARRPWSSRGPTRSWPPPSARPPAPSARPCGRGSGWVTDPAPRRRQGWVWTTSMT
jgi:predicted NBD/HSP70 family sugar kinase